jgi:hypothetical protein
VGVFGRFAALTLTFISAVSAGIGLAVVRDTPHIEPTTFVMEYETHDSFGSRTWRLEFSSEDRWKQTIQSGYNAGTFYELRDGIYREVNAARQEVSRDEGRYAPGYTHALHYFVYYPPVNSRQISFLPPGWKR